jgi:hypothetical protein
LKDAFHHLSGNALVLLVVVGRARVVWRFVGIYSLRLGETPSGCWSLLSSVGERRVVLSWTYLRIFFI